MIDNSGLEVQSAILLSEAAELVHEDEIDYKLNSIIKKIFEDEKLKEKLSKNLKKISNNNSTELIVDQIENYIV